MNTVDRVDEDTIHNAVYEKFCYLPIKKYSIVNIIYKYKYILLLYTIKKQQDHYSVLRNSCFLCIHIINEQVRA